MAVAAAPTRLRPPVRRRRRVCYRSAVVVLGAGWEPEADWPAGTRLNDSSVQRLMEGLRLLQGLPEAKLVTLAPAERQEDRDEVEVLEVANRWDGKLKAKQVICPAKAPKG